ncbi:MAG: ribosome biogenesis GTPase Der [Pseudomonadota bacterium]
MKTKPIVAIIGRPNVGKSTLFNALAKKNIAIVHDLPGVTRDRNYIDVTLDAVSFTLVDTGGFDPGVEDAMGRLVQEHARVAVEEADLIIFLMDGKDGLMYGDEEIARILQRSQKPVLYTINKVESRVDEINIADFYKLGIEPLFSISAKNRLGISDLMDAVCKSIPESQEDTSSQDETVVSIIGRPNVGKSSFINKLLGYERLMVSSMAGTTRDPVDSLFRFNNKTIRFIDTAGIRKKSTISYSLEKYCVFQALKSINRSSICMLMLDASQGVTTQDAKLAAQIYDRNRACILVINKWDLIEKDNKTHDAFTKQVQSELAFIDFAPVVTVSALTGLRVRKILEIIIEIARVYEKRVSTPELNRGLKEIYDTNPPPRGKSSKTNIYYAAQVDTGPPMFKLFTNNIDAFPDNYRRYLERSIREKFALQGVPICLHIRQRDKKTKKN